MKIERLQISSLTMDPENAKLHPDFQIEQIKKSIQRFGMNDPVGIWGEQNLIVEGHGRVLALQSLGQTEVDCIRLDHLTDDERKAYAVAHNSTNMSTGFDNDILQKLLKELPEEFDMAEFGLAVEKLDDSALASEDEYEPNTEQPIRVHAGEVWGLGRHRLICGDSTNPETLDCLMGGARLTPS